MEFQDCARTVEHFKITFDGVLFGRFENNLNIYENLAKIFMKIFRVREKQEFLKTSMKFFVAKNIKKFNF